MSLQEPEHTGRITGFGHRVFNTTTLATIGYQAHHSIAVFIATFFANFGEFLFHALR
jgi:hypothetical protein